jgi:hypothetical protein
MLESKLCPFPAVLLLFWGTAVAYLGAAAAYLGVAATYLGATSAYLVYNEEKNRTF